MRMVVMIMWHADMLGQSAGAVHFLLIIQRNNTTNTRFPKDELGGGLETQHPTIHHKDA